MVDKKLLSLFGISNTALLSLQGKNRLGGKIKKYNKNSSSEIKVAFKEIESLEGGFTTERDFIITSLEETFSPEMEEVLKRIEKHKSLHRQGFIKRFFIKVVNFNNLEKRVFHRSTLIDIFNNLYKTNYGTQQIPQPNGTHKTIVTGGTDGPELRFS